MPEFVEGYYCPKCGGKQCVAFRVGVCCAVCSWEPAFPDLNYLEEVNLKQSSKGTMNSIDPKTLLLLEYERARQRDISVRGSTVPSTMDFLTEVNENAVLKSCYQHWLAGDVTFEQCLMMMVMILSQANKSLAEMYLNKIEQEGIFSKKVNLESKPIV